MTASVDRFSTAEYKICVMDPDGSNVVSLTGGGRSERYPDWHPTKNRILFTRDLGSQGAQLLTINPDTTDEKLASATQLLAAQYSPNGKKIIGVSGTPFDRAISIMNADGSNRTPIRNADKSQADFGGPAWRPIPPA